MSYFNEETTPEVETPSTEEKTENSDGETKIDETPEGEGGGEKAEPDETPEETT